jgi:hypothetical protein
MLVLMFVEVSFSQQQEEWEIRSEWKEGEKREEQVAPLLLTAARLDCLRGSQYTQHASSQPHQLTTASPTPFSLISAGRGDEDAVGRGWRMRVASAPITPPTVAALSADLSFLCRTVYGGQKRDLVLVIAAVRLMLLGETLPAQQINQRWCSWTDKR